mmetsp:Transcript_5904/g.9597  ORF Transcript_5904/g.9597 Transcript_5904/m.9597 type:complete len:84 (+) Transcript_5904:4542-4793(+)
MSQPDALKSFIKLDVALQKDVQIQNICITIDKVVHVLRKMNQVSPPILKLSEIEVFKKSWVAANSHRGELERVLAFMEPSPLL